jgi:hypothetical protein
MLFYYVVSIELGLSLHQDTDWGYISAKKILNTERGNNRTEKIIKRGASQFVIFA